MPRLADGETVEYPSIRAQRGRGRVATVQEIMAVERLFAQSLEYELEIPGNHPVRRSKSGAARSLTNQQLFEILARQGRDFAKNSRSMRAAVLRDIRIALEGTQRIPKEDQLKRIAAIAILNRVLERMDGLSEDVKTRNLTTRYAREKMRAGYVNQPIGTRTGWLRNAVAEAKVMITSS